MLTEKQTRFVEAMAGEAKWCATKAARIAGYRWPGKQGSVVARHPAVAPIIKAAFDKSCPLNSWIDETLLEANVKAAMASMSRSRRRT